LDEADTPATSSDTQIGMVDRLSSELGILVTFLVIMGALLALVGS